MLHLVDSLDLGGAQAILKSYFERRRDDANVFVHGLRTSPQRTRIDHPNASLSASPLRFSLSPLPAIARLVRRERIEVLHCHLFRAQSFGWALKRFSFPRIGLVFHEHGRAVGREGEPAIEALAFRMFLRRAVGQVDRFVCNSDYTRAGLLEIAPAAAARICVVPNPIPVEPADDGEGREESRRALGVPEGAFVVGFASRLVERKGWRDLVDALASLKESLPLHYLIAGDGDDRDAARRRIADLGLEGRGRMLGRYDVMARFYRALDCFAMPSHWEPHGLAHLEAQGFGIPVIVASVPGMGSTVHSGVDALGFRARDAGELAQRIRELAADPGLRARLSEAGRANARRYSMQDFTRSLEEIHLSVRDAR